MWNGTTTVALYETLGEPALRYIIDQTEMTTIACASETVKVICRMKSEDDKLSGAEQKMQKVKFLISFEEVTAADLEVANKVNLQIYTWAHVLEVGKNNID